MEAIPIKQMTNDHRTRVTQMMIRKAFTDLMSRKPIESITIAELCKQANINRSTFYNHYKDIYDLRDRMETSLKTEFYQALKTILVDEPVSASPVKITAKLFECIQKNADMCSVILGSYGDKKFLDELIQIGREFVMKSYHVYFVNASPKQIEYFYAFVSSGIVGLLQRWLDEDLTMPPEEIAKMAESLMLQGAGYLKQ